MQFVIAVSLGIYLFGEAVLLLIGRQASHEMGSETGKATSGGRGGMSSAEMVLVRRRRRRRINRGVLGGGRKKV